MPDFSNEHETAIANNDLSMIDPQLLHSLDEGLQSILAEAMLVILLLQKTSTLSRSFRMEASLVRFDKPNEARQ